MPKENFIKTYQKYNETLTKFIKIKAYFNF